jgi:hypothetical protein
MHPSIYVSELKMKNRITTLFKGEKQEYYKEVCNALHILVDANLATLTWGVYRLPDLGIVEDFGYTQTDDQYTKMTEKYDLDTPPQDS